jgi:YHS domain-containing protein
MKAQAWRPWVSIAAAALAVALVVSPAAAANPAKSAVAQPFSPGLPDGLPELPRLGEVMQRDLQSGLALNGFDPVAYQLAERAVAGRAEFELDHRGVVWRFASAANREAFRDAPEAYEPAFAGFDASGVANGVAVETDPRQFAVIGSRLFLFRTRENRDAFVADRARRQMAEARWSEVYQTIAR